MLRHTAQTFCCEAPYEVPSGGDWSIHRGGAVFLENASYVEFSDNIVDAPGGNGIALSNSVQNCEIHHNEVRFAGDSCIIALGSTAFMDGRADTHPRDTQIHHNHLHDWGLWGKQTSAYFGSLVRRISFDHNVLYNGPRAGSNLDACLTLHLPIATSALLLLMAVAASNRTCLSLSRLRLLPHLLSDQVSIKTMALLEARLLVITCCSTRCLILATTATSTGQSHNNLLFHDPVQMQFFLLTA